MRRYLVLFLVLSAYWTICAQSVNMNEAETVARNFFQIQEKSFLECAEVSAVGSDTLFYIFNADNGFVVISADRRTVPVLAYSDHTSYRIGEVIPPVKMWLDNYRQQMQALRQEPHTTTQYASIWQRLLTGHTTRDANTDFVAPLVQSHWGQGKFYNYYCPVDFNGENQHVVTGCVATAMAQLIYYFRFPETGIGSYSYIDEHYGLQEADYGATTYDYSAMCDNPTSISDAISTLMHHCGVGVDMVYGPNGSGMYNHSAAYVLRTYFKYSPNTQYVFRDSTDLDWDSLIVTHLHNRIPLYYAGWSDPNVNGHAFLCDGYQRTDSIYHYHFNFGWDGDYDGYFYTNALTLVGTHFNFAQELIVNAYPDTSAYPYPTSYPLTGIDTLVAITGSFSDGSWIDDPAQTNMDRTWVILPDEEQILSIDVAVRFNLGEADTLFVQGASPAESIVLTDTVGSLAVNWQCTKIVVRYISGSTGTGNGIRGNYNTTLDQPCENYSSYGGTDGTISDGSGNENYAPYTDCFFNLHLSKTQTLFLHLTHFDLEEGHDYLYIFSGAYSNDNMVAALTGNLTDSVIQIDNIRRVFFLFHTDARNNASGFDIDYHASGTGVDEITATSSQLYPNPATDRLVITHPDPIRHVEITDLAGHQLRLVEAHGTQLQLSVGDLPSGLYFVTIQTNQQRITKKFIKQ